MKKRENEASARETEATSKETLEDLEEKEASEDGADTHRNSPGPSPDGAFDEADSLDEAGPM
jgi:hypothetical protein